MDIIIGFIAGALISGSSVSILFMLVKVKRQQLLVKLMREISVELDAKDPYFNGHTKRIANYAKNIAKELKFSQKKLFELEMAVFFSEMGKLRIPEDILKKREKLTEDEYNIVKKHPIVAYKMMEEVKEFEHIANMVKHHHERYDGKGYPDNIAGEAIPLEARIINIVDSFDAMTSVRPYRKALSPKDAIDELVKGKGAQFDSRIVDIFVEILKNEK